MLLWSILRLDIASIVNCQAPIQRWNCRVSVHCYLPQRSLTRCKAMRNRKPECYTRGYFGGPERPRAVRRYWWWKCQTPPWATGVVLVRVTGGELADDGWPIETNWNQLRPIENWANWECKICSWGHPFPFAVQSPDLPDPPKTYTVFYVCSQFVSYTISAKWDQYIINCVQYHKYEGHNQWYPQTGTLLGDPTQAGHSFNGSLIDLGSTDCPVLVNAQNLGLLHIRIPKCVD